jgi:hypothetical protein
LAPALSYLPPGPATISTEVTISERRLRVRPLRVFINENALNTSVRKFHEPYLSVSRLIDLLAPARMPGDFCSPARQWNAIANVDGYQD